MFRRIKLKDDLEPNEYVIVCINRETKEAEYVAYMEDAPIITSKEIEEINSRN